MDKLSSTRFLEVVIISAEDLRIGRRSIKKNAFLTVETAPNNSQSTSIDTDGGSYPSWYENFEVPLLYGAKHVKIVVYCKVSGGERPIGSVNIPVSDFLEDYVPSTSVHFLSYRLRESNGNPNGIVNLSILVKGPQFIQQSANGYRASNVGVNYVQQATPSHYTNVWASAPSL